MMYFGRLVKYELAKSNWNILDHGSQYPVTFGTGKNTKAGVFPSEDVGMGSTTDTWRSGTKKCFQLDFVSKQIHGVFVTSMYKWLFSRVKAEVIKDVINLYNPITPLTQTLNVQLKSRRNHLESWCRWLSLVRCHRRSMDDNRFSPEIQLKGQCKTQKSLRFQQWLSRLSS